MGREPEFPAARMVLVQSYKDKIGNLPPCSHCEFVGNPAKVAFCDVCGSKYPKDVLDSRVPTQDEILAMAEYCEFDGRDYARSDCPTIARGKFNEAAALRKQARGLGPLDLAGSHLEREMGDPRDLILAPRGPIRKSILWLLPWARKWL